MFGGKLLDRIIDEDFLGVRPCLFMTFEEEEPLSFSKSILGFCNFFRDPLNWMAVAPVSWSSERTDGPEGPVPSGAAVLVTAEGSDAGYEGRYAAENDRGGPVANFVDVPWADCDGRFTVGDDGFVEIGDGG